MKQTATLASRVGSWLRERAVKRAGRRASHAGSVAFRRVTHPWDWEQRFASRPGACFCIICWWSGESFLGPVHSERAICPRCGSIARDRFLFFCFVGRNPSSRYRVLETSPRLGKGYQRAMRRWFDYRASDFDQRLHRSDIELDLQNIHLESGSVDILLTQHVLEHVPDTDRALEEIHRVLAPEGAMYLQVPILQGATARPTEPELHGDDTPVEWRFGLDLTERLREHGFRTRLLCTEELHRKAQAGCRSWPHPTPPELDVTSIMEALFSSDLVPVAGPETARRIGFRPSYMFLTWECRKSAEG
jgi:predicted SAM-dependent methyltransferase